MERGGSRTPIMTAYRQRALACADALAQEARRPGPTESGGDAGARSTRLYRTVARGSRSSGKSSNATSASDASSTGARRRRPRLNCSAFTSLAPYGSAVPRISRAWRTAVALARSCASRSRRVTALSSNSISGGGLAAISSNSSFARTCPVSETISPSAPCWTPTIRTNRAAKSECPSGRNAIASPSIRAFSIAKLQIASATFGNLSVKFVPWLVQRITRLPSLRAMIRYPSLTSCGQPNRRVACRRGKADTGPGNQPAECAGNAQSTPQQPLCVRGRTTRVR